MSNWVTLTLAHPLTVDQVARLRAKDVKALGIGEKITVPRDEAASVIDAGYAAGVDPANRSQVAAALKDPELAEVPTIADVAPSEPASGQADDGADTGSGSGKKK